jgi:phosphoadenosine phosphosulfate reductase
MDTSVQIEYQSIEYEVTDKTVKNENHILKNQSQQHIHPFEIRKKHKLLNGLNANEQKLEDVFQIKSEIDAPCTAAEALTSDNALETLNQWLETQTAERRVAWALSELPGTYVLSSSFGAQAAVSLHLLTTQKPDIPVLLVDTGYLFPETYNFIDQLHERLQLNLHVLRPEISAAWFEARHGRLWEQGVDGINLYNSLMKLKPMQLALDKLDVKTWFAGLRRNQSESRQRIRIIERQNGRWKVHPIADWTDRDVGMYLRRHNLPYHPLWKKGYVSIGDVHTTRPLESDLRQEDTRFFGLNRECGLHRHI